MRSPTFKFKTKVYTYVGRGVWYMITLPVKVGKEIDILFSDQKRGWGSLPVAVRVGETVWETSIFPDREKGSYIMLLKKSVRIKETILENKFIEIELSIRV